MRAGLAVPIAAGRFRSFDGGRTVVYARGTDQTGQLEKVFIKQAAGSDVITTVAQRAHREVGPDGISQTIVLQDGERTEGVPGTQRYRFLRFVELRVPLTLPAPAVRVQRLDERATVRLVGSDDRRERAELQWRLGLPIMVLVAAACAMALGPLRPRQGRYQRVGMAVFIFAIYGNLATAARTWFEHGLTPAPLGLWWVHLPFIVLCLWLARKYA
jgi:lipopolysaccharide export system permease protein